MKNVLFQILLYVVLAALVSWVFWLVIMSRFDKLKHKLDRKSAPAASHRK